MQRRCSSQSSLLFFCRCSRDLWLFSFVQIRFESIRDVFSHRPFEPLDSNRRALKDVSFHRVLFSQLVETTKIYLRNRRRNKSMTKMKTTNKVKMNQIKFDFLHWKHFFWSNFNEKIPFHSRTNKKRFEQRFRTTICPKVEPVLHVFVSNWISFSGYRIIVKHLASLRLDLICSAGTGLGRRSVHSRLNWLTIEPMSIDLASNRISQSSRFVWISEFVVNSKFRVNCSFRKCVTGRITLFIHNFESLHWIRREYG